MKVKNDHRSKFSKIYTEIFKMSKLNMFEYVFHRCLCSISYQEITLAQEQKSLPFKN